MLIPLDTLGTPSTDYQPPVANDSVGGQWLRDRTALPPCNSGAFMDWFMRGGGALVDDWKWYAGLSVVVMCMAGLYSVLFWLMLN